MAWTWDDYAKQEAERLGMCEDEASFRQVLLEVRSQLDSWKTSQTERDIFWSKLKLAYQKAPKLMLKEATAAAKLMVLKDKADALIAQAQQAGK